MLVRGVSVNDGNIRSVRVNGHDARPLVNDYSQWQVEIDLQSSDARTTTVSAVAEDTAGNVEFNPHRTEIAVLQPEQVPR